MSIDARLFFRRLARVHAHWKANRAVWGETCALSILRGRTTEEDALYERSAATHLYLMGYEFPDTLLVLTDGNLHALASKKKASMLAQVKARQPANSSVDLTVLTRNKADEDGANFERLRNAILASSTNSPQRVGVLMKEAPRGSFAGAWNAAMASSGFTLADVSQGLGYVLAIMDETAAKHVKQAALCSARGMKFFQKTMEGLIDEGTPKTHNELAELLDGHIDGLGSKEGNEHADVETCYFPIIQSGGIYNLKVSAQSNDKELNHDTVICSLGTRYAAHCSNIARTFIINPTKRQENAYKLMLKVQAACISTLKPGVRILNVRQKAADTLNRSDPSLAKCLTRNCGFGMAIEFRNSMFVLNGKNQRVVRAGMIFNVSVGLENVDDAGTGDPTKVFSMLISDTVLVGHSSCEVLTDTKRTRKGWSDISYTLEGSDDGGASDIANPRDVQEADSSRPRTRGGTVERRAREDLKESKEMQMMTNQRELMEQKRIEALRHLDATGVGVNKGQTSNHDFNDEAFAAAEKETIQSYRSTQDFPRHVDGAHGRHQIFVDMEAEAVLLPINGRPVPFHISTIKSVSKSEEERATYLRLNFFTPAQSFGRVDNAMKALAERHPNALFIKELSFRSLDPRNSNVQFRMIKELQKRVRVREQEKAEKADIVEQPALIRTTHGRVPRLQDLSMRPQISGRKTQGTLEAHTNGLRFKSTKGESAYIIYTNVRHAIYQPCVSDLIVLIHFHLKHPIIIGKKKCMDIQFYTEVVEASQALDGRRRSMYDPDELDEEQRERQLKKRLNDTFKAFCQKVEGVAEKNRQDLCNFDIPYRDLGFSGVVHKEMVFLQPSVNCLVTLTEYPPFVLTLDDIEHVHFERVNFGVKAFDVVIILKDLTRTPVKINAIPMDQLDLVKEWLNDINVCFTAGPMNLNWKTVMNAVRVETKGGVFWKDEDEDGNPKDVGWRFLEMHDDDDEVGDGEEESEYEASGSSDDEDDDFSEYVDSDEESDSDDDDDDGTTWEDLEKEAAASDRMKRRRDEEYDRQHFGKDSGDSRKRRRKR